MSEFRLTSPQAERLHFLAHMWATQADGTKAKKRYLTELSTCVESLLSEPKEHEATVVEDEHRGFHGSCSCGWLGESVFMYDIAMYDNRRHKEREELMDR